MMPIAGVEKEVKGNEMVQVVMVMAGRDADDMGRGAGRICFVG